MSTKPKFKIGQKVFYFFHGIICEEEIKAISIEKDGVYYVFGSRPWEPVPEKHINLKSSDFKDLKKQYDIDLLKKRIERLKTSVQDYKERIQANLNGITKLEEELKELIGE